MLRVDVKKHFPYVMAEVAIQILLVVGYFVTGKIELIYICFPIWLLSAIHCPIVLVASIKDDIEKRSS